MWGITGYVEMISFFLLLPAIYTKSFVVKKNLTANIFDRDSRIFFGNDELG